MPHWLNVWSVYFYFNIPKLLNPMGIGEMYKLAMEIPEGCGGGGSILVVKKWKFQRGGEACVKFPPWWGVWIFFWNNTFLKYTAHHFF